MGWERDGAPGSCSRAEVSLGKGSVVSKTVTRSQESQYEKSLESGEEAAGRRAKTGPRFTALILSAYRSSHIGV